MQTNVQSFYQILEHLNKNLGITLVLVTHDIGTITDKVTDVIHLNKKIWFQGNAKEYAELSANSMSPFISFEQSILQQVQPSDNQHGGYKI